MKRHRLLVGIQLVGLALTLGFILLILLYCPTLKTAPDEVGIMNKALEGAPDRVTAVQTAESFIRLLTGAGVVAYDFLLLASVYAACNLIMILGLITMSLSKNCSVREAAAGGGLNQ